MNRKYLYKMCRIYIDGNSSVSSAQQNIVFTVAFLLFDRFVQRCPIAILQSSAIEPIVQCGVAASKLVHREANASVTKFFHELIQAGTVKWVRSNRNLKMENYTMRVSQEVMLES